MLSPVPCPVPLPDVRGCFDQVLSEAFFAELERSLGLPPEQGVYTRRLVCWLLLHQRLAGDATLSDAVAHALSGAGRALLPNVT